MLVREVGHGLNHAVVEDLELVPLQVRDQPAGAVHHRGVERHRAGARLEGRALLFSGEDGVPTDEYSE